MIKMIFDEKQPETTLSSTGRVLICVNEQELQMYETVGEESAKEELVTKYQYDTLWVKPIKQTEAKILEAFKSAIIDEIAAYYDSDDVHSFTVDGNPMWLDSEERLEWHARLSAEQNAGYENTVFWYGNDMYNLTVDYALELLDNIELYASECYDTMMKHKVDIINCKSIADVGAYDITAGYPEVPSYPSTPEDGNKHPLV